MADGRTPVLAISSMAGSVTFEDLRTAFPFAGIAQAREYEDRFTRLGESDPPQLHRIFRAPTPADKSLSFTVPLCTQTQYNTLRAIIEQDVPECEITYLHLSAADAHLVEITPVPDDYDWYNYKEFSVSIRLVCA